MDFQKGDVVETNEGAKDHARQMTLLTGLAPVGKTWNYQSGERGIVDGVGKGDLVYVQFADGDYDCLYSDCFDLIYRPINDPALYEQSLLDLIEAQS